MSKEHKPNALINESSPYLLQHAYNPVNWLPWSNAAFHQAKEKNKPVIISIGYSACHWCHVMEKECFEDEATAAIMNEHFICIKVDREERPDIDAIYMDAVQLMTGRGGWPLNCMTMPDQKPIYGGTYFPKQQWQQILLRVSELYHKQPEQCRLFADELAEGVNKLESVFENNEKLYFNFNDIYKSFAANFDHIDGGMNRSPKFPMPSNWEFLLQYYYHTGDSDCIKQLELTLKKIANGGINDQLGGGFARYSTDMMWKVPHFEKMLYDNAQLVSLYSHAYQLTGNQFYKDTVYKTLAFIKEELTSPEDGFYSALDADSEGIEGKYYIWTKEELEKLLSEADRKVFYEYYKIEDREIWEEHYFILQRNENTSLLAEKHALTVEELEKSIANCNTILISERNKRTRPGLDNKILCSWNALMLKGYLDAYTAFSDPDLLQSAQRNADFILRSLYNNQQLLRMPASNGKTLEGFLDDYAFTIDAFTMLYQCTGNHKILITSIDLMKAVLNKFYDSSTGMFFYTSIAAEKLIARKTEVQDNVINSSNSMMCRNLFILGTLTGNTSWIEKAEVMINKMQEAIQHSAPWYAHWAQIAMMIQENHYEVIICGKDAALFYNDLASYYLPDCILAYNTADDESNDLFKGRFEEGKTGIYICTNNSCRQPVYSPEEAHEALSRSGHLR